MSNDDRQQGHFTPEHQPTKTHPTNDVSPKAKGQKEDWPAYYLDYFMRRPVMLLIVIGLLLEVQPYEPIQPTYFIATRIVNREEIVLKGTEDEAAHKEGVTAETLAQIEKAKDCQKQRDIGANAALGQCVHSGKAAGYCRHVYEQSKAVFCPEMPKF
jgi:hypothetical protein